MSNGRYFRKLAVKQVDLDATDDATAMIEAARMPPTKYHAREVWNGTHLVGRLSLA